MMLGAHVLFTCDDGYYLSGYDDSSICAATGEWTAHYTECKSLSIFRLISLPYIHVENF